MKRALVTGGCGFIGSNLTKELVKQGWQVDIVDDMSNGHLSLLGGLTIKPLSNASLIYRFMTEIKGSEKRNKKTVMVMQDDFAAQSLLDYIKVGAYDVIFHQAAVPRVSFSVEYPYETTITNIAKTVALFDAAKNNVKRVINASSSSVYGGADKLPTKESENKKNPKSPYAWQKSAIEDYSKICWDLYSLDVVNLRYFNVFGPGQYGNSPYATSVSAWCHAIKHGKECRSDGDGEQSRDMCYIDNVVSANILAANAKGKFKGLPYNIACGQRVSNNEILDYLKQKFGNRVKVKNAPERPGDVKHTQANVSYAYQDFGYKPLVEFWPGLEKTIEWWDIKKPEADK
jgi:nucleoside-diphosphate-sugar epimerase